MPRKRSKRTTKNVKYRTRCAKRRNKGSRIIKNFNSKKRGNSKRTPRKSYTIKGGSFSNLLGQDIVNVGRGLQFNIGSAYNTVNGYNQPVNPLPWNNQMSNSKFDLL
jgi:hypothetical protein|tara:strand:- start:212 stop:532 length:321 start_codon:yes stop_codon:yes gene_type:complete